MTAYTIYDGDQMAAVLVSDRARNSWALRPSDDFLSRTLHESAKGRWWVEHCSAVAGESDSAEIIEGSEAAAVLLAMGLTIDDESWPASLTKAAESLLE